MLRDTSTGSVSEGVEVEPQNGLQVETSNKLELDTSTSSVSDAEKLSPKRRPGLSKRGSEELINSEQGDLKEESNKVKNPPSATPPPIRRIALLKKEDNREISEELEKDTSAGSVSNY